MSTSRLVLLVPLLAASAARAGAPQTWSFDESTQGRDVLWTSPTAVNPGAELYVGTYQLTLIEVTVEVFGFPVAVDVTGQVPPELATGSGEALGPAPVILADQSILYPEPPEPTTLAADITVELDGSGFGVLSATNIVLGTADTPFGTLPIQELRIAGTVEVLPTVLADVTRDGVVNVDDLVAVVTAWGACPAPPETCPADVNLDGTVGVDDLVEVIVHWD